MAHRSPAACNARYASLGIHVNDLIGRASANCAATDGYRASSRCPRRLALSQLQVFRKPVLDGDSRARHTVPEPQHPHPAAVEHMMQRGIVHWIRESPGSRPAAYLGSKSSISSHRATSVKCENSACVGGYPSKPRFSIPSAWLRNPRGPDASMTNPARRRKRCPCRSPTSNGSPFGCHSIASICARSRYSTPSAIASLTRKWSTSLRSQCVSDSSSLGLAATSS